MFVHHQEEKLLLLLTQSCTSFPGKELRSSQFSCWILFLAFLSLPRECMFMYKNRARSHTFPWNELCGNPFPPPSWSSFFIHSWCLNIFNVISIAGKQIPHLFSLSLSSIQSSHHHHHRHTLCHCYHHEPLFIFQLHTRFSMEGKSLSRRKNKRTTNCGLLWCGPLRKGWFKQKLLSVYLSGSHDSFTRSIDYRLSKFNAPPSSITPNKNGLLLSIISSYSIRFSLPQTSAHLMVWFIVSLLGLSYWHTRSSSRLFIQATTDGLKSMEACACVTMGILVCHQVSMSWPFTTYIIQFESHPRMIRQRAGESLDWLYILNNRLSSSSSTHYVHTFPFLLIQGVTLFLSISSLHCMNWGLMGLQ